MDGLIVKPKWCDKILYHNKRLEVRGFKTRKTGKYIYLLESETSRVRGTFKIQRCISIDEENWEKLRPMHQVDITYKELLKRYKKPFFWVLDDVKERKDISYYLHPKGAVVWVKDVIPTVK